MDTLQHLFESESVFAWLFRLTLLMVGLRLGWHLTRWLRPEYRLLYFKTALFSGLLFLPFFIAGVAKAPVSPTPEKYIERFSSLETSDKVPPSIQWFPRWLEEEEWAPARSSNELAKGTLIFCLMGSLAFVVLWARDQFLLSCLLREARPADSRVKRIVEDLAKELKWTRPAEALVMGRRISPFACGFIEKKVVLDEAVLAEWNDEELRMTLAHELAHARSNDVAWQQMAGFLSALFWFHPLAWGLRRQYGRLTERVSDDAAMYVSKRKVAYARLLAKVALAFNRNEGLNTISAFRGVCSIRQRISELSVPAANPLLISLRLRLGLTLVISGAVVALACAPTLIEASTRYENRIDLDAVLIDLENPHWKTRSQAALRLAKLEKLDSKALNPLVARLSDQEWMVRKSAAMAIAKIGPEGRAANDELIHLLGDEEWLARQAAAFALAAIGPSRDAIPALEKALTDEEWHVRKPVVIALGNMRGKARSALPRIVDAIGDPEWYVRKAAIEAAARIASEGNALLAVFETALEDEEGPVRAAAARALLRLAGAEPYSQPTIIEQLNSENPMEIALARDAILEIASN